MTAEPRIGPIDTAPHDRYSNRIQLLEIKLEKLENRIGELMTQRVDAEEALAARAPQGGTVMKFNDSKMECWLFRERLMRGIITHETDCRADGHRCPPQGEMQAQAVSTAPMSEPCRMCGREPVKAVR
jgi:hypothetical protein